MCILRPRSKKLANPYADRADKDSSNLFTIFDTRRICLNSKYDKTFDAED